MNLYYNNVYHLYLLDKKESNNLYCVCSCYEESLTVVCAIFQSKVSQKTIIFVNIERFKYAD